MHTSSNKRLVPSIVFDVYGSQLDNTSISKYLRLLTILSPIYGHPNVAT